MKIIHSILGIFLISVAVQASDLVVPVPKSEIKISEPTQALSHAPTYLELNASSWTPSHLSEPSVLPNTTGFGVDRAPRFSIGAGLSGWDTRLGFVAPKLGASYMSLQRQGFMTVENAGYMVSQTLNLFQGRFGAEWTSHKDIIRNTRSYVSVMVLPSWIQSGSSQFNDGVSEVNWAAELSAGLLVNVAPFSNWMGLAETALVIGVETTQGLTNAQLAGTGFVFGARVGWN